MRPFTVALTLGLWFVSGMASTPAADEPVAPAKPEAKKAEVFKPPPGFITKKCGKHVLYCKREAPMGTRLKSETCYDEAQIRDYLLARAEMRRDVDRMRAACGTIC